jgi:hypothetical protein
MKLAKIIPVVLIALFIAIIVLYVLYENKVVGYKESMVSASKPVIIDSYSTKPVYHVSGNVYYDPTKKSIVNLKSAQKEGFKEAAEGKDNASTDEADESSEDEIPINFKNFQDKILTTELAIDSILLYLFSWKNNIVMQPILSDGYDHTIFLYNIKSTKEVPMIMSHNTNKTFPSSNYPNEAFIDKMRAQLNYNNHSVFEITKEIKFDPLNGSLLIEKDEIVTVYVRPNLSSKMVGVPYPCTKPLSVTSNEILEYEAGTFNSDIISTSNLNILYVGIQKDTMLALFGKVGNKMNLVKTYYFTGESEWSTGSNIFVKLDTSAPTIPLVCSNTSGSGDKNGSGSDGSGNSGGNGADGKNKNGSGGNGGSGDSGDSGKGSGDKKEGGDMSGNSWKDLEEQMKQEMEKQNPLASFYMWMNYWNSLGKQKVSEDYILKTQVVPPVCPSCPSCYLNDGGVCNTCGGKGGSGTNIDGNASVSGGSFDPRSAYYNSYRGGGSGGNVVDNIVGLGKNTIDGTVDLTKHAIGSTVGLGRDVIGGTVDLTKQTLGTGLDLTKQTLGTGLDLTKQTLGTGLDLTKQTLGTGVDLTKQAIGGTLGLGREVIGGAVGLGREVVGGAVGLGREVAGEVAETVGDVASALNPRGGINVQSRYGANYMTPNINMVGGGYMQGGYAPGVYGGTGQIIPQSAYPRGYGVDPMTYYGASSSTPSTYVPITADFSAFGR